MEKKIIDTLSIVTFISNKEKFNSKILKFYIDVKSTLKFSELIIFSDKKVFDSSKIHDRNIHEEICPNTTKYKRILLSLSIARSENIIFIDNDISPDNNNLQSFLKMYRSNIDLYFGRVGVNDPKSKVEKLVKIDKNISHKIIRPILWKCNMGISVPGQVFMIRKEKFAEDLEHLDTVFDDLSIGICAKEKKYIVQISKLTLGYEKASDNIATLIKQRIRWAKGYSEMLAYNKKKRIFPLVVIHGLAYHIPTVVADILLILLAKKSPWISVGLLLGICMIIGDFEELPISVLYMIIFPIIHIVWFVALLENIIKKCRVKV